MKQIEHFLDMDPMDLMILGFMFLAHIILEIIQCFTGKTAQLKKNSSNGLTITTTDIVSMKKSPPCSKFTPHGNDMVDQKKEDGGTPAENQLQTIVSSPSNKPLNALKSSSKSTSRKTRKRSTISILQQLSESTTQNVSLITNETTF